MMTLDSTVHKAEAIFEALVDRMTELANEPERCDRVEREIFRGLLDLGRVLLGVYLAQVGKGDVGEHWERDGQVLNRQPQLGKRIYHSIFGMIEVWRTVYAVREKQKTHAPLDRQVGFPEGSHSYFLQDILQRFCVRNAFDDSVASLKELFGLHVSKLTAEKMNQKLGTYIDEARDAATCSLEFEEEEAEILVASADGKGVPMRGTLEKSRGMPETPTQKHQRKKREAKAGSRSQRRLYAGHGQASKQMAWLGAVYSIPAIPRTADDVLGELDKSKKSARPKPVNKRIQAMMTDYIEGERVDGKDELFESFVLQIQRRDPTSRKTIVCLMDGQSTLWDKQSIYLPTAVQILDIFHVTEKLWDASYCFHPKTSREADVFVERYFRRLLEGEVAFVIRSLRGKLAQLQGEGRKKLEKVIRYYDNNQSRMKYDEYLANGYPIASGVIEGGCRHLVKDRMDCTGMRWRIDGAKAMLNARATYINGDWDRLFEQYVQNEQNQIYRLAI